MNSMLDVLALDDLQKQKQISCEQLAKKAGVSYATVCDLRKGNRKPRRITVLRIARALGVTEAELMKGDDLGEDDSN